jgi:hypothetical protein
MKRFILLTLTSPLVVASCGQASSPIEKQDKKGGVEQAAEQEPSAPDTPQEIKAMSDRETIAFGECQLRKMVEDRGQKATEAWMDEKVQEVADAPKDAEITSIQEDLWAEGYTCTPRGARGSGGSKRLGFRSRPHHCGTAKLKRRKTGRPVLEHAPPRCSFQQRASAELRSTLVVRTSSQTY